MSTPTLYCAGCGKPMLNKCCNNVGYWAKRAPLPQDRIQEQRVVKGYYLYLNMRCSPNSVIKEPEFQ